MSAASTSAVLRHVPPELLKEILLKLPVKSLLRFSTVSKSWLSMISESRFVQEHNRHAAVNGVKMMITVPLYDDLTRAISLFLVPHTSSTAIDDSTHLICPIEGIRRRLRAFCVGLFLVEAESIAEEFRSVTDYYERQRLIEKSLHLWNPSTRTHRKLPDSLPPTTTETEFAYGLGYDSSADDYKVLKIAREESSPMHTELYSLKSDSWKTISPPPPGIERLERCEYVNGSLHWIRTFSDTNTVVSFDLSTEKYGEILFPSSGYDMKYVEVVVVSGKLCVIVNNEKLRRADCYFVLWMMEEYGVERSWTKVVNIEYDLSPSVYYWHGNLKPVHIYGNGDVLFFTSKFGLCMYKNESARFERIVITRDGNTIHGAFIYVESLVSLLPKSN